MNLRGLLINVSGLNQSELAALASSEYKQNYTGENDYGILVTHDGHEVFFWHDRPEHAFRTSISSYNYGIKKEQYCSERISRLKWIGPVISGNIPGTSCYEIPDVPGQQRLYTVGPELYVVWLERRLKGGWKFSSAYTTSANIMRNYAAKGKRIWRWSPPS